MNIDIHELISTFDNRKSKDLKILVYHERNKSIFFSSSAYYMREPSGNLRILSGLLPSLKNCFWKDLDYYKMLGKLNKTKSKKNINKTINPELSYGRYYGKIRGSLIHRQLNDYLIFDLKNFKKKYFKGLHPWAEKIFELIKKYEWIPLISEFDCFDAKLKIGTSIDMICYCKKTGKIIALEIKTGYKNNFENENGYMTGCLRRVLKLSFLNCAILQLLTSILFIVKNHQINLDKIEGHIIQVNNQEINEYTVSNDLLKQYGNKIYNSLYRKHINNLTLKRKLKKERNNPKNYKKILKTPIKKKKKK